ncbi:hypothetical protein ACE1TG_06030 [Virgibacillus sp. JSM 102003]
MAKVKMNLMLGKRKGYTKSVNCLNRTCGSSTLPQDVLVLSRTSIISYRFNTDKEVALGA